MTDTAFHSILIAHHCALDDGDISEACRLMYTARKAYVNGAGNSEDVELMKAQDLFLHSVLGYSRPA